MKRYLVFAGDAFYPSGGWCDFFGDADTLPDALVLGANAPGDWWHVVDTDAREIVKEGHRT